MKPPAIYEALNHEVIGQSGALREVSVALYKHLIGHKTGNIMMIGGSGTGKTTIMKAGARHQPRQRSQRRCAHQRKPTSRPSEPRYAVIRRPREAGG